MTSTLDTTIEAWAEMAANPEFSISTMGRVRGPRSNGVLSPSKTGNGYPMVKWRNNWRWSTETIHRAVAKAFIPNPDGLREVNHKNGVKTDNRAENLEWVSRQGNVDHAMKTGLAPLGEATANAKLNPEKVREALRLRRDGLSQAAAATILGVTQATIGRIETGETWGHVTGITKRTKL